MDFDEVNNLLPASTPDTPAHQTPQNRTSDLNVQPLPHFINSTHFIIQKSTALCNFNIL